MKKPLTLGELSGQSLTKQKTIEDTVIAQIASEFQSLKQIIIDSVKNDVQSFLNDLKSELKDQQRQSLNQLTESNQQLHDRINSFIDNPELMTRLEQFDTRLTEWEQRIVALETKAYQTLTTLIEQTETRTDSLAKQTEQALQHRIDSEQTDYQTFLRQQRQWRSQVTQGFLLLNKLPVSVILILFCLLVLSMAVNLAVLMKTAIWSTFLTVLVCLLLFILLLWVIFMLYQIYQQNQAQEE